MILFGSSKTRDGFVRVRDLRAVMTACTGSWRKCFAIAYELEVCLEASQWHPSYVPDIAQTETGNP